MVDSFSMTFCEMSPLTAIITPPRVVCPERGANVRRRRDFQSSPAGAVVPSGDGESASSVSALNGKRSLTTVPVVGRMTRPPLPSALFQVSKALRVVRTLTRTSKFSAVASGRLWAS